MCSFVGEKRAKDVQQMAQKIDKTVDIRTLFDQADVNGSGLLDLVELHQILEVVKFNGRILDIAERKQLALFGDFKNSEMELAGLRNLLITGEAYACFADSWTHQIFDWKENGPKIWRVNSYVENSELLEFMLDLNGGTKVGDREKVWIESLVHEDKKQMALILAIAFWYTTPKASSTDGLWRNYLIERLTLENEFQNGILALVSVMFMFVTLMIALQLASRNELRKDVRDNLYTTFMLDDLSSISETGQVYDRLKDFSTISTMAAPLSFNYLEGALELMILEDEVSFSAPVLLPPSNLDIGASFTLQAWLQVDKDAHTDSSLRARPVPLLRRELSVESPSSCWNWLFPPGLAFGAQDYGGIQINTKTYQREEVVDPVYSAYLNATGVHSFPELGGFMMHTIVANQTHARFYEGPGRLIGEVELPRVVTDCKQRLLIGSHGITLSSVRYFPNDLSAATVAEIYAAGAPMSEIGYSTQPAKLDSISSLELFADQLSTSGMTQEKRLAQNEQVTQSSSVLVASAVLNPTVQPVSLSTMNYSIDSPRTNLVLTSMQSWHIYGSPIHIADVSAIQAPGLAWPAMTSAGFTLSFWAKPDGVAGYLWGRALPASRGAAFAGWRDYCWYSSVGMTEATYFKIGETSGSRTVAGVNTHLLPDASKMTGRAFRHFVFRVDPANTTKYASVCMDGVCNSQYHYYTNADGDIPRDCESLSRYTASTNNDTTMFLAGRPPSSNWPFNGYVMNAKYFPRALSDQEIASVFNQDPDPDDALARPVRETRGCKRPEDVVDNNNDATDDFGHDCLWYFKAGLTACRRSTWAIANCPVACESAELCFGSKSLATTGYSQQIFARQFDFQPVGAQGTTCIAKSTTPEAVAVECGRTIPAGGQLACDSLNLTGTCSPKDCSAFQKDRARLLQCLGDRTWPIVGTMPCKDIIELNDPFCAWEDSMMEQIGNEANSTGSWALQFWFESLSDQCQDPRIRLFDSRGALIASMSPDTGESPNKLDMAECKKRGTKFYVSAGLAGSDARKPLDRGAVLYTSPSPKGARHVVAFGMKDVKVDARGAALGTVGLQFDSMSNFNSNVGTSAIRGGRNFLKVINIAGPIRMSPMKLTTEFPSASEMGAVRSRQLEIQAAKTGPSKEPRVQAKSYQARTQMPFLHKSLLISPPFIVQQRAKAGPCGMDLSSRVVKELFQLGSQLSCQSPYTCLDWDISNVYQCKAGDDIDFFFGSEPVDLGGLTTHMEYLSAITAHKYLLRTENSEPAMLPTRSFIDTLTTSIEMHAIFYSIEFGIITELVVSFDTAGGKVQTESSFNHYVAVIGEDLELFKTVEILVFTSAILWLLVQVHSLRVAYKEIQLYKKVTFMAKMAIFDIIILILLIMLVSLLWMDVDSSGDKATDIVGRLTAMAWEIEDRSYLQKRSQFVQILNDLTAAQNEAAQIGNFAMVLSVIMLGRMVWATSAHPRISSVTSTLRYAFDNLAHFIIVFLLIFCGFAFIATWRFGHGRAYLGTFGIACKNQFDSMLNPPGVLGLTDVGEDEVDFLIYAVLFHVMCLFFLMNFVLAIIVDSYTKAQAELEASPAHDSMMNDTGSLLTTLPKSFRHRWPEKAYIIHHLKQLKKVTYIKPADLMAAGFRKEADAVAFCKFYGRFGFMNGKEEVDLDRENKDHAMERLAKIEAKVNQVVGHLNIHRVSGSGGGGGGGTAEVSFSSNSSDPTTDSPPPQSLRVLVSEMQEDEEADV